MINRKKLEAAIADFSRWGGGPQPLHDDTFCEILAAAEALREFLPRPRWKLRATFDGDRWEAREWSSMEEAMRDMSGFLAASAIRVEIEAP